MTSNNSIPELLSKIEKLETENQQLKNRVAELEEELEMTKQDWANDNDSNVKIFERFKSEINDLKLRVKNLELEHNEESDEEEEIIYPTTHDENKAEWFDLKGFDDYEIKNIYPYEIRRKSNEKVIKDTFDKINGYIKISLNDKTYKKHIIVAKQFISNDDPKNKKIVDHKNHDRTDYNINNLRWVSARENSRNNYGRKGVAYKYVDELPQDCIKINLFRGLEFEDYYIDQDRKIWFYNGNQFRKLTVCKNKTYDYVKMTDINNKCHTIGLNSLIQELM